MSRGQAWLDALSGADAKAASVRVHDAAWNGERVRLIGVVPNPSARFPRARAGQFGIEEGWTIAERVHEAVDADRGGVARAIVLVVDVPGQAFGYHEEALALHDSLAAAVGAYATARDAGHPVVALIVGKAISGAFLAHGLQASTLIALDDAGIEVHVMSQSSVARVTRRSEDEVAALAKIVPSTARDIHSFADLGAIERLLKVENAVTPTLADVESTRIALLDAIADLRTGESGIGKRLENDLARKNRALSVRVRQLLEAQWDADA